MKLGVVYEDGTGGLTVTVSDVGEHDVDDEDGFSAAVEEGCAAVGWRPEWEFCYPASHMESGYKLILCRPQGGTPVLPAFMDPV